MKAVSMSLLLWNSHYPLTSFIFFYLETLHMIFYIQIFIHAELEALYLVEYLLVQYCMSAWGQMHRLLCCVLEQQNSLRVCMRLLQGTLSTVFHYCTLQRTLNWSHSGYLGDVEQKYECNKIRIVLLNVLRALQK